MTTESQISDMTTVIDKNDPLHTFCQNMAYKRAAYSGGDRHPHMAALLQYSLQRYEKGYNCM